MARPDRAEPRRWPNRRAIDLRLGAICTFANLLGAVFVFLFLVAIAPPNRLDRSWLPNVLAFTAFGLVAFPIEAWLSQRDWNRALAWLKERREPTDYERFATLRIPFQTTALSSLAWLAAATYFPIFSLLIDGPHGQAPFVALTIFDGGLVTCAVAYLSFERVLRPVFAAALATGAPRGAPTVGILGRLVLTWVLGAGVPLSGLVVLPFMSRNHDLTGPVVALAVAGLVVGLLMTLLTARTIAEPLRALRDAIGSVGRGQLDVSVEVDDAGEVGMLENGVNEMVAGLRERRRLADLFGRHVGPAVAALALEQGSGLTSEQRDATAMFVDIVGSTALAEVLTPDGVVATLNAFFDAVAAAVAAEGGWVNKFQGDGALCVFGAPAVQPDHAARALRAARSLRQRLVELAATHPGIDAGIGVSSGPVVAGNVGTEQRYEYTIIGAPVNEAARLTEIAKGRDGRVLASAAAVARCGAEAVAWQGLGSVALRGRSTPTNIYEPLPERALVS